MLRDDIAKYTELTGEDGAYIPIIKLGAFLDGYERGLEEVNKALDKIIAEINELYSYVEFDEDIKTSFNMVRLEEVQKVIDKHKAEGAQNE